MQCHINPYIHIRINPDSGMFHALSMANQKVPHDSICLCNVLGIEIRSPEGSALADKEFLGAVHRNEWRR